MHFAYIQDDFKFNPKLTLNLGLRYEFATPQFEDQNRLANFDPETVHLIQATDGSLVDRALVEPDRNNFAPRLGIAYQLSPQTAIRGGYGISYIHFNRLGGENILGYNGPNVVNASLSQQISQGLCAGNGFLGCFRPTQASYPEGLVSPERFNPLTARVNFTPRDARTGYVQSWHLTVQREHSIYSTTLTSRRQIAMHRTSDAMEMAIRYREEAMVRSAVRFQPGRFS
jgi:outer membrane receptor protein involved in Fe transport